MVSTVTPAFVQKSSEEQVARRNYEIRKHSKLTPNTLTRFSRMNQ